MREILFLLSGRRGIFLLAILCGLSSVLDAQDKVRIVSYNVQNYLIEDRRVDGRWRSQYPKPEIEKQALREVLQRIDAEVVLLQEMGPEPFLLELQDDLRTIGLDYPHGYVHQAMDEKRHVAILSRFPFEVLEIEVRDFPYFEERIFPKRGLLAVRFDFGESAFMLFGVHLKSRYTDVREDPQSHRRRSGEARVLRDAIRRAFPPETDPRYILAGDFNDGPSSSALGYFKSVGNLELARLLDAHDSREHRWTHYYAREDVYSRIDYFLASPALYGDVIPPGVIDDGTGSDLASDHRGVWIDLHLAPKTAQCSRLPVQPAPAFAQ